jgi:hypothetical protein
MPPTDLSILIADASMLSADLSILLTDLSMLATEVSILPIVLLILDKYAACVTAVVATFANNPNAISPSSTLVVRSIFILLVCIWLSGLSGQSVAAAGGHGAR